MLRGAFLIFLLAGLTGCQSFTAAEPLVIAPTSQDWANAFLRLSPGQQKILGQGTGVIAVSPNSSSTIYRLVAGSPSTKIDQERLDLAAIAEGYNQAFQNHRSDRWEIFETVTKMQSTSPNGIRNHYYELSWKFRNSAKREWAASAYGSGQGVKLKMNSMGDEEAADANLAFAVAFLRLMARSEEILQQGP